MEQSQSEVNLPWWTWILPFFLALIAKSICYRFFFHEGFFYIYGSYVLCLPLYFIWGPRVFWSQALAEALTANIVGLKGFDIHLLHGVANASKPLMGYCFFLWASKGKYREKIDRSLLFFFWTLLIASLIANIILVGFRYGAGDVNAGEFLPRILKQTLRDCFFGYVISFPLLEKLGPFLKQKNLSRWPLEKEELAESRAP
ncbi:hypothetical protein [Bdellovibrio sp. HCB2-146]|uniref:hypothetical protein n=1 Tax=Bdellovibrio sp. HCB2-146 TaxID=3394362 RepID=UPI0039BD4AD2